MKLREAGHELLCIVREAIGSWLFLAWMRVTTPAQFNMTMKLLGSRNRMPGSSVQEEDDILRGLRGRRGV